MVYRGSLFHVEQAFFCLELAHKHYQERKCSHGNKQTQSRDRNDVAIDWVDVNVKFRKVEVKMF